MRTSEDRAADQLASLHRRNPEVVELARVTSLAVRVEPHLLRALRLKLLPHLDVGSEADLWFSSLVESRGSRWFVLKPAVAGVLRADLANEPELLGQARQITQSAHAYAPPSLALEEELHFIGLSDETTRPEAVERALRPALRTMTRGGEAALDLAHWALRALPQTFPGVFETANGFALVMAAQALIGPIVEHVAEIAGSLDDLAWAIPPEALSETTPLFVELLPGGLRFSATGLAEQRLELPNTTPLLLEIRWAAGGTPRTAIVQAEPGRSVDLGGEVDDITLKTVAGDTYSLTRQASDLTEGRRPTAEENRESPEPATGSAAELSVEMLPVGHGTSLLFTYGEGDTRNHMLVDGGPAPADAVRARLSELEDRRLELLVISHIDDDRIHGVIRLLEDPEFEMEIDDVWFNGDRHLGLEEGDVQ